MKVPPSDTDGVTLKSGSLWSWRSWDSRILGTKFESQGGWPLSEVFFRLRIYCSDLNSIILYGISRLKRLYNRRTVSGITCAGNMIIVQYIEHQML